MSDQLLKLNKYQVTYDIEDLDDREADVYIGGLGVKDDGP